MPTSELRSRLLATLVVSSTIPAVMAGDWPFRRKASPELPNSPEQIARTIDAIEERILDDGVVVVKRPDVFGERRMTLHRIEFEQAMATSLRKSAPGRTEPNAEEFSAILSARIARTEQAALLSEAAVAGVLTPLPRPNRRRPGPVTNVITTTAGAITGTTAEGASTNPARTTPGGDVGNLQTGLVPGNSTDGRIIGGPGGVINQGSVPAVTGSAPGALAEPKKAVTDKSILMDKTKGSPISLEPTIFLDQKKRFLDHLNEIRRTNLGDDVADSAGYGVYLFRMPVSIQPGEHTLRGHGAIVTATIRHGIDPRGGRAQPEQEASFLAETFRRMVVTDLVDELGPVIYEIIRSGLAEDFNTYMGLASQERRLRDQIEGVIALRSPAPRRDDLRRAAYRPETPSGPQPLASPALQPPVPQPPVPQPPTGASPFAGGASPGTPAPVPPPTNQADLIRQLGEVQRKIGKLRSSGRSFEWMRQGGAIRSAAPEMAAPPIPPPVPEAIPVEPTPGGATPAATDPNVGLLASVRASLETARKAVQSAKLPSTRNGHRPYPVGPGEFGDVFLLENLLRIAGHVRENLVTEVVQASDVATYLRHEIAAAFDLLRFYEPLIRDITPKVVNREYQSLAASDYPNLAAALPGDLKGSTDRVLTALCWAVAVDAGLLNRSLHEDMRSLSGRDGFDCPNPEAFEFYAHAPSPETDDLFRRYVMARWPMVAFAVDPYVDQQNIADAFSQRRDLQLALAYSFATGRINFSQLTRFTKRLELDAETIALNRTVTSFSHGSDTFGWRFYPRYQTPPNERNNLQTVTNLLLRGGPGRNYQIRNSKLEPGQRELTVIVVMPSFLDHVRFEVATNWFPLHDPDQMKVESARMIRQGKQLTEVRGLLASAEECGHYRPGDLQRLATRIDQVEAMLPLQTLEVQVPYETTSAGFQLFTAGSSSTVPELTGFQGVNWIPDGMPKPVDILLQGKHFSLQETRVMVSGTTPTRTVDDDTSFDFEILSRELIRLRIPAGTKPMITADEKRYLEVRVATPNGLSNRMLIPYGPPPAATVEPAPEPTVAPEALTVTTRQGQVDPGSLRITGLPAGADRPAGYSVVFHVLPLPGQQGLDPIEFQGVLATDPAGEVVLEGAGLRDVTERLIGQLRTRQQAPQDQAESRTLRIRLALKPIKSNSTTLVSNILEIKVPDHLIWP